MTLFGIPLLAMMYPRGPKIQNEHAPEVVAHAARIGAELGADIIKTNYTGNIDTFKTVVESCPVPVVIAGGPKCKSLQEVLQTTYDALKAGAAGLIHWTKCVSMRKPNPNCQKRFQLSFTKTHLWSKRLKFSVKNVEGTLDRNRPKASPQEKESLLSLAHENADVILEGTKQAIATAN